MLTGVTFILYAMPAFLLGTLLILWFAIYLPIFSTEAPQSDSIWGILSDPQGAGAAGGHPGRHHHRLLQPLHALLDDGDDDRGLRAHGPGQGRRPAAVLYVHALRNAIIPIITLLGLSLGTIVSGAVITESVFNYPGMGLLAVNCRLQARTYPRCSASPSS